LREKESLESEKKGVGISHVGGGKIFQKKAAKSRKGDDDSRERGGPGCSVWNRLVG